MLERHTFDHAEDLAQALAGAVVADIVAGIAERGVASIAVSGGSTPKLFLQKLGECDKCDWTKVTVTLVDERWVDESSDRSNAALVRKHLLKGPAEAAYFVPLYAGGAAPDAERLKRAGALQEDVPYPPDAVVLGMGTDGHTASFFPQGDSLAEALESRGPLVAINAPGAEEPRVTLTLPHMLKTRSLYLHIEGGAKAEALARAEKDGPVADMPVRAVLRQHKVPLNIYWCP